MSPIEVLIRTVYIGVCEKVKKLQLIVRRKIIKEII